ncbi:hypothetical protein GCM10020000_13860 [Streptomyces olivoverticillatus]
MGPAAHEQFRRRPGEGLAEPRGCDAQAQPFAVARTGLRGQRGLAVGIPAADLHLGDLVLGGHGGAQRQQVHPVLQDERAAVRPRAGRGRRVGGGRAEHVEGAPLDRQAQAVLVGEMVQQLPVGQVGLGHVRDAGALGVDPARRQPVPGGGLPGYLGHRGVDVGGHPPPPRQPVPPRSMARTVVNVPSASTSVSSAVTSPSKITTRVRLRAAATATVSGAPTVIRAAARRRCSGSRNRKVVRARQTHRRVHGSLHQPFRP